MGYEQAAGMDVRKRFQEASFEVTEVQREPETLAVKKTNCTQLLGAELEGRLESRRAALLQRPGPRLRARRPRLPEVFWFHLGRRFPVRVNDLRTLHHFDQEVRTILGIKSLYHESLGTTSTRSVYDRLDGRPDQSPVSHQAVQREVFCAPGSTRQVSIATRGG